MGKISIHELEPLFAHFGALIKDKLEGVAEDPRSLVRFDEELANRQELIMLLSLVFYVTHDFSSRGFPNALARELEDVALLFGEKPVQRELINYLVHNIHEAIPLLEKRLSRFDRPVLYLHKSSIAAFLPFVFVLLASCLIGITGSSIAHISCIGVDGDDLDSCIKGSIGEPLINSFI